MITHPVNISPKGQVVLPKAVRHALNTHHIVFEIVEDTITIKPLLNVKGSLTKYQISKSDFSELREQAWEEGFNDRQS